MRAQVVHHQNGIRLGAFESRHQDLLEIGQQHGSRNLGLDAHRGDEALTRERTQDRQPLPGAERDGTIRPLSAWSARMGTGHLGRDAAFIQEHQAFRGKHADLLALSLTLGGNLGPILLGRPKRLFFGRSLMRLSASQITARHTVTPVRSARRSRYSRSSASLSSITS